MEKLSDIFTQVRDRISNPLVFSFISSWLIFNWKITMTVIIRDSSIWQSEGFSSIIAFIDSKLNKNNFIIFPTLAAIIYTLVMPNIKNLIRAFYSWTSKWGNSMNLKILKNGQISIEKFIKLRQSLERQTKLLEEIINGEKEYLTQYNSAQEELVNLRSANNSLMQTQNASEIFVKKFFDVKLLNGYWVNNYDNKEQNLRGSEEILIDDGKYYLIKKFGDKELAFNITNFSYHSGNKSLFFIKLDTQMEYSYMDGRFKYNINNLVVERDDLIIGYENGTTRVEYRRKDESGP